jgi:S-DNA-T family DNA segregation ATPase FtsK/SpoIIIE
VVVDPDRPATLNLTRIYQTAQTVATHKHTRRTARHAGYIPLGGYAVARALWLARSTKEYDRRIAACLATGQQREALQWEAAKASFIDGRHKRRMERRESFLATVRATPYIAGGFTALLLFIGGGLGIANHNLKDVATPIMVVAEAIRMLVIVVSVAWGPLVLAAPWLAVAALWHVGRRYAMSDNAPGWIRTSTGGQDITIDESTIASALKALNIAQINEYLKIGTPMQFLVPCRVDGRGTHAVIRLPKGVTAEKVARRRGDLATGLYRQAKEVWPSTGDEAGILDLWIADKGALAEGAGPYPLLESGFTDVFKGVPFGRNLRGEPRKAPLIGRNTIVGGMPEQGKSSGARDIMCGAALDPTAELRIYVPDSNYDFEVMRPRCSRYEMGADDDTIGRIRDDLLDLKAEVQSRGELLIKHQVPEVTRELASAGVGLHPLFVLLEEAHVAIQHAEHGKEISQLLIDIVKLDRKRGIHVIVSTQAPTANSMPRDVTRNCTNGVALAVGDHVANDALLGQGAYKAGHRATELIPGTDVGTALCKGFSGQRSEMIQLYFLSVASGNDQVTPIIERSLAEIARRGLAVPGTDRRRVIESRELLADVDAVIGHERVNLADLPPLLRQLAPRWPAYGAMTGLELRGLLDSAGVRTTNTGNVPRLDPADLRAVLRDRPAE